MLRLLALLAAAAADDLEPGIVLTRDGGGGAPPNFEDLWQEAGLEMPWVIEARRERDAAFFCDARRGDVVRRSTAGDFFASGTFTLSTHAEGAHISRHHVRDARRGDVVWRSRVDVPRV